MSNQWGVKLRKTGLNEQRLNQEELNRLNLEQNQSSLGDLSRENNLKMEDYDERQGSLAASAMMGQQGRLNGGKKNSRRHRKRSSRKQRKTKRHHKTKGRKH